MFDKTHKASVSKFSASQGHYVSEFVIKHIDRDVINEHILKQQPVPDHPDLVVPLCDDTMLEMVGNKAVYVKAVDKSVTKIQRHSLDVMGPLAQA